MKQIQIIALWCLIFGVFFTEHINAQTLHWLSKPGGDLGLVLNDDVSEVKVSANGLHLSFRSDASNIVAGDTNQKVDIFVHDSGKNTTVRVADQYRNPQDDTYIIQFSAPTSDGKWISFIGEGDFGFAPTGVHLYLQNIETGSLGILSVDSDGAAYEVDQQPIYLADDASTVIFVTDQNLSPLHTDSIKNIYSKNLINDNYTLLSKSAGNASGADKDISNYSVSGDFRYIAMSSGATNLVNNTEARWNVFLRDTHTQATQLVTVKPNGAPSSHNAMNPPTNLTVSNTGLVAFVASHDDLVPNDNNSRADLFLFNRSNNKRINVDKDGQETSSSRVGAVILSPEGTRLVFTDSEALLAADNSSALDIYSYRIDRSKLSLITHAIPVSGSGVRSPSAYARGFPADGESLVLLSNLNQSNSSHYNFQQTIYKYDFNTEQISDINPALFSPNTLVGGAGLPAISNDQQWVVYVSDARNLTSPVKPDNSLDLFLLDRSSGSHQVIGRRVSPVSDISASGRYIVYGSEYSQPAGVDYLGSVSIFLHDRLSNEYRQVAEAVQEVQEFQEPIQLKVNNAGKVVFSTFVSLIASDTNNAADVYLFNPDDDSLSLISVNTQGVSASGHSREPDISDLDDQIWVVFSSSANDLIATDNSSQQNIFMRQWPDGPTVRISQTTSLAGGNRGSLLPSISGDGTYVVFSSAATNLTNDDYSGASPMQGFIYDRANQNLELVTKHSNGLPIPADGSGGVLTAAISNSGGYIAYWTQSKLLPEDDDESSDIYLYDYINGLTKLISKTSDSQQVADWFGSPMVVEDTTVSPSKVGVVFSGKGGLTDVAEHPGNDEIFLYQQDGYSKTIFKDGFE